jgi:imidazolonepropionase-like amidohydrolase
MDARTVTLASRNLDEVTMLDVLERSGCFNVNRSAERAAHEAGLEMDRSFVRSRSMLRIEMSDLRIPVRFLGALLVVACATFGAAFAQSSARPQLYAVRNVRLSAAPDALRLTLILRDGRIAAIQDAEKEPPPEARVIDGAGLIALPAFIDAYAFAGVATPVPTAERDVAPKPGADVLVDMREADRKGVEPSVHAADLFKLDVETAKHYRGAGFGALLSAPHGQLLSGTSMLATTRDAAPRDATLVPLEFDHAGFETSGPGYPGTLMGAVAQLKQFFLDALHYRDLERRRAAGKPTSRTAYDADLVAIQPALSKQRRVVCEAQGADDIERWIKLADEFGLDIAISGGRDAWKRATLLSAHKIPVFLTLDWGDEVDDPHAKDKKNEAEKKLEAPRPDGSKSDVEKSEPKKGEETKPGAARATASSDPAKKPELSRADSAVAADGSTASSRANQTASDRSVAASSADARATDDSATGAARENIEASGTSSPRSTAAQTDAKTAPRDEAKLDDKSSKTGSASSQKPLTVVPDAASKRADSTAPRDVEWTYEEPLRVREDKRHQWEETRNCALRLSEANVSFVFGSGKLAPKDLLDHVRTLVEGGLSPDAAQRALTSDAAALLGVPKSLGKIEAGFDATLALWTKNPLTSKDAKLAWLIVDGFPYEFDLKAGDLQGKPDEGVDVTGTWTFEFDTPDAKPAVAELKMSKDGAVKGTIRYRSPVDDKESSGDFEGRVASKKLKLTGKVKIGSFESQVEIDGDVDGDAMTGSTAWKFSGSEDSRHFKATRKPKGAGSER